MVQGLDLRTYALGIRCTDVGVQSERLLPMPASGLRIAEVVVGEADAVVCESALVMVAVLAGDGERPLVVRQGLNGIVGGQGDHAEAVVPLRLEDSVTGISRHGQCRLEMGKCLVVTAQPFQDDAEV